MRGFEQIPWAYDAFMTIVEAFGFRRWRRWLAGGSTGLTLEIGAGTGRNLSLFNGRASVVGADPDLRSLLVARRRAPEVPLVAAAAEALPFRDDTFDTVASCLVFCSVADPARGLSELHRVVRSSGSVRMVEHVRSRQPWLGWLQDLVQPAWTRCAGGCHPNRDTESAVLAAGFRSRLHCKGSGTFRRLVATPTVGEAPSREARPVDAM